MVSQQELAHMLNITRSSVAVHITNLMKKWPRNGFVPLHPWDNLSHRI